MPRIERVETGSANGSNGRRGRTSASSSAAPRTTRDSIGRLRGFQGNFGVFVRSYAYILSLGGDGLAEASETAVLNANYLLARMSEGRAGSYLPIAFDRRPMHEFVLSGSEAKRELGVKTLDIAKRLLDHNMHPPTVYFPLLVDEALMIEPTETETRESLDGFADAVEAILAEAEDDPEIARQAPYTTPVRRLDEAGAATRSSATRSSGRTSARSRSGAPGGAPAPARTGRRRARSARARSPAVNRSCSGSPPDPARSTSSQRSGVETVGCSRARSE